jgi:hypothetical protein
MDFCKITSETLLMGKEWARHKTRSEQLRALPTDTHVEGGEYLKAKGASVNSRSHGGKLSTERFFV